MRGRMRGTPARTPPFSRHSAPACTTTSETAARADDNDAQRCCCIPVSAPPAHICEGPRQVYACIYSGRRYCSGDTKKDTVWFGVYAVVYYTLRASAITLVSLAPSPRHQKHHATSNTHLMTEIKRKLVPPPGSLVSLSSSHVTVCLPSGRPSAIVAKRPMFLLCQFHPRAVELTPNGPRTLLRRQLCPPFL